MALPQLGSQLLGFCTKYKIETDIDLILDCVAKAGYKGVEGGPADAAAYKKKLEARGLVCGGSHTGLKGLLDPKPLIKSLKTLGATELTRLLHERC